MTSSDADRPSARQLELVQISARLFAARGYHSVGINEISGALGLTGPAFYRHYPSKEHLLVAVLDHAMTSLESGLPDGARLEPLVENHMRFVMQEGHNIHLWRTELRDIPESARQRLRQRQRQYVERWVAALRSVRPDLDHEHARAACGAALSLLQSPTEYASGLAPEEHADLLVSLALRVLQS